MANITKRDVDIISRDYVKGPIRRDLNSGVGPYHRGRLPDAGRTNTGPIKSVAAANLSGNSVYYNTANNRFTTMTGATITNASIKNYLAELLNFYTSICVGRTGLHHTSGGSSWIENQRHDIYLMELGNSTAKSRVAGDINALAALTGNVTQAQVIAQFSALHASVIRHRNSQTVDLTVCHSSCHSSCHGSRGRR